MNGRQEASFFRSSFIVHRSSFRRGETRMAADWYCEINGEQHGPVTSAQLRQLAVARKLHPSHPVWKEGMQKKVQARTVKGLFDVPPAEVVPVPGAPKRAAPAPKQEEELIEFEM